ncbi:anti-sigma factor domain-containing protein [Embleya sp. NPDC008237]|uniref:anti-sigma factor n=1 Tax=Embleya sp. NPDC008237 TaxID=3363978 RepID=UPI0036F090B7
MTPADLHTLTGAYSVHALDEDEQREFESHLAVCPACTQEVGEFRETAARLASSVGATPSAELRRRVLDGISTVRQLPPELPAPEPVVGIGRRRTRRVTVFVAAACLAVIGALGGVAIDQYQDARRAERAADAQRERSAGVEAVITAPDAVQASAPVTGGGTAKVIVSRALDRTVLLTTGLPSLSNARVYQGWYDDNGHMRSIGVIRPGMALLASAIERASGVGLTVEPAGGSAQPTGDPIVLLEFPAGRA